LRGRIDADAIWGSQSPANLATYGELNDAIGLRRARIGVEGEFASDSRYISEIDLASGDVVVRDLFVGFGQIACSGELRVGHFREPFSLEGATSANTQSFMERSAINTLDPSRNWGVGYFRCNETEDVTLAFGVFHSGTDASDFQGGDGSDTAATARWTSLPYRDGDQVVHLGFALSARVPDQDVVLINQQPTSPLLDLADSSTSPFVPTIRIPARFQQLVNVQWAWQDGPLTLQAEWYGTWIDQIGGEPVFLHGSYIETGYFLTGERRAYHVQHGNFGGIEVSRPVSRYFSSERCPEDVGYGAWELTARFAFLDFADADTRFDPQGHAVGVRLSQATLGVNWYLADRLRVMFNYVYAVPDEPNTGASAANIFATRLAMYW
jgi:phosphate-selective porin OprO/OprP